MKLKTVTVIHVTEEEEKALNTVYEAVDGLSLDRCDDVVVSGVIQDLSNALSNFYEYVSFEKEE